jgi:hypothetical protein
MEASVIHLIKMSNQIKLSNMNSFKSLLFTVCLCVFAFSCKDDDPAPAEVKAETVKNLNADYAPAVGGTTGPPTYPTATNKFTLFSFANGIIANADSASTKWDIGFRATTIIVNGGTSGPGAAGAIVQTGIFDEIATAPTDGYLQDNKNAATSSARYAIPTGSGNGWYSYSSSTNVITPIAGRVIIIKTTDGKYAKMEILSYYQDAPASPTSDTKDRYYTFRYVFQPNESQKFGN